MEGKGVTIRYIDVGNTREEWELQEDRFCPGCGTRGVWLLESVGTRNNNDIGLCLACDTAWEWTSFSEEWIKARALKLRAIGRNKGIAHA